MRGIYFCELQQQQTIATGGFLEHAWEAHSQGRKFLCSVPLSTPIPLLQLCREDGDWDNGGCGIELPRDGRDMTDVQGGDMMLSVIWEKAGMGFLEGTGADSSPEGIVSLGFVRVLVKMAVRELWVRMEGPVPVLMQR